MQNFGYQPTPSLQFKASKLEYISCYSLQIKILEIISTSFLFINPLVIIKHFRIRIDNEIYQNKYGITIPGNNGGTWEPLDQKNLALQKAFMPFVN